MKVQKKYLLLLLLAFMTIIVSCKQNKSSYFWVSIPSKGSDKDTCYFQQETTIRNDSFILDCNTGNAFSMRFIFDLKDKHKVYYHCRAYSFANSKTIFEFIADTTVTVNGHNFTIKKYYLDQEHTYDAAEYYYWVREIGIVYFSSLAWGTSERLYTNNKQVDDRIAIIIEAIQNWEPKRLKQLD